MKNRFFRSGFFLMIDNLGMEKGGIILNFGAPRSVDRLVGESPTRLISYSAGSDGDSCSRKAHAEALPSGR
jgi:hypothetical protein